MSKLMLENFKSTRTTVTLPQKLLERSQKLIDEGKVPNRNALIIAALDYFISEIERVEIDRQFAAMAEDTEYQTLNEQIADSFAESDWDAWGMVEEGAV